MTIKTHAITADGMLRITMHTSSPCDDVHFSNMVASKHMHPFTDAYAIYRKHDLHMDSECEASLLYNIDITIRDNSLVQETLRYVSSPDSFIQENMDKRGNSIDSCRASLIEFLVKRADSDVYFQNDF
jgi:hypothetical protein